MPAPSVTASMIDHGKKSILGVQIDAVDYDAAVERFVQAAKDGRRYTTTALAVHGVMTGALEPQHRFRLNQLDMIVPDGMPVRWGLNSIHKTKLPDRVYGPSLMLKICERAAEEQLPIFLFGSDSDTLVKLQESLKRRFPSIQIAGAEPSKFKTLSEQEADELSKRIVDSGAKMTFVGLGCPRQEVWVFEYGDKLKMPAFAVGAAFPFHAGALPQAPSWMQKNGLEWLFRLTSEPKRLWRRYLYLNPAYLFMLACQKLGIRSFDTSKDPSPTTRINYG